MQGWGWAVVAGAGFAVAVAGWLYWQCQREAGRLQVLLDAATMRLERLQGAFDSFAPPAVVEQIIEGSLPTGGEKLEVTVLFADIVGFTSLAESVDPSTLVEIINGYFECMSRAITEHRGHVSALIGDGLLAFFGVFEPNPWQGNDGVYAALAMRAELVAYNVELQAKGLPQLGMGVGLHRGTGVAGLVGSREKTEFTVMGRTINAAARLQSLTREHGVDILLTEDMRQALDPRFALEGLGEATLRGIHASMPIYAVVRFDEQMAG